MNMTSIRLIAIKLYMAEFHRFSISFYFIGWYKLPVVQFQWMVQTSLWRKDLWQMFLHGTGLFDYIKYTLPPSICLAVLQFWIELFLRTLSMLQFLHIFLQDFWWHLRKLRMAQPTLLWLENHNYVARVDLFNLEGEKERRGITTGREVEKR